MVTDSSRVEAILREHKSVRGVVVSQTNMDQKSPCFVALVSLNDCDRPTRHSEQVASWGALFDEIYADSPTQEDSRLNIAGWESSIHREALSPEEMHEWVSGTVSRLLAFDLGDVLEIGCGTGMLLSRLAPRSRTYHAIDISEQALLYVRGCADAWNLRNVTLQQCDVGTLSIPAHRRFNTIILNSVIQYFPSEKYLSEVIKKCLGWLAPGGRLFVGDVRNLRLQEDLCLAMALGQMGASAEPEDICRLALKIILEESELLVDPDWFYLLQNDVPDIGAVQVELRR